MTSSSSLMLLASLSILTACEGPAGPAGDPGSNGSDGADGLNGEDGMDGDPGADGEPGMDGEDWPGPVPAEYEAADGIMGGAAYSQWYNTPGGGMGSLTDYSISVSTEFVRCKSCHAWDGYGNAGSYADRTGLSSGTSSRPDVSTVNLRTTAITASFEQLFELIDRPEGRYIDSADSRHPDFSADLTEEQVWNLMKFMREEWINPNDLYDLSISGSPMHYEYDSVAGWVLEKPVLTYSNVGQDGDAVNGQAIYAAECALCHGADGRTNPSGGMSMGQLVRSKPHEAWFKIKFGEPGKMDPGIVTDTEDMKDLYAALADSSEFPDL